MKRTPKWAFFAVAILIVVFACTTIFGLYTRYGDRLDTVIRGVGDIRWGIDIQGGVDVTFGPKDENINATPDQMEALKTIIETRMVDRNITDYEAYVDTAANRVIVRFPWADNSSDPKVAVEEIGKTAQLVFRYGSESTGQQILTGNDVASAKATAYMDENGMQKNVVELTLKDSGREAFSKATAAQYANGGNISIWLDEDVVSDASVNAHITDGKAVIEGDFTYEAAKQTADLINGGALPFAIEAKSLSTISPTLGNNALMAMAIAGAIAMLLVCVMMIVIYRLPGFVAAIALCGQMALTIAFISGYFAFLPSFTMTLPGVAGLILSIGIGVDCNVITAESVRDELRAGKTIDGAIRSGSKNSFWAIFDGNITVLIVAVVLMGVFGSSDSIFGWLFSWLPVSTTGSVYSFGYTLLVGVATNFLMGIWLSRLMLRSISRLKIFRKPWFYGGER